MQPEMLLVLAAPVRGACIGWESRRVAYYMSYGRQSCRCWHVAKHRLHAVSLSPRDSATAACPKACASLLVRSHRQPVASQPSRPAVTSQPGRVIRFWMSAVEVSCLHAAQVQGMGIEQLLQRQRSVVAVEERSTETALQAALGNHPPTADLTPFIFRPLMQVTPPLVEHPLGIFSRKLVLLMKLTTSERLVMPEPMVSFSNTSTGRRAPSSAV